MSLPLKSLSVTASAFLLVAIMDVPAAPELVDFESEIYPIFAEHCHTCHGPDKQKSRLRLDTPQNILKGGNSGEPVLLPGRGTDSHLLQLVTSADPDEVMPAKGDRLSPGQIDLLKVWIDQGAKMPGVDAAAAPSVTTDHWSFQPVRRPSVPTSDNPFIANEIDSLILKQLSKNGLVPSPPASRETLIRRLYLVTLGLPPSTNEVNAFVQNTNPDAYERLVRDVLASPRYGERWARHWLDVVRYADSNGFETNRERKSAFHYRDYVIRALNADMPYDRFIREQIVGDALGADAATGFLVAGPYDIVKSPDISLTLMQRQNELDDMVNTTGTAFLGLTLGCARCHNHKFDPVLQKDYYSLQAVFAGVNYGERPLRKKLDDAATRELESLKDKLAEEKTSLQEFRQLAGTRAESEIPAPIRPPVNAVSNMEMFETLEVRAVRFTILGTSSGEPCIDELEIYDIHDTNIALSSRGAIPTASGTLPGYEIHKLTHLNDGMTGNAHSWISDTPGRGWVQIEFPELHHISSIVWSRDRNEAFSDRVATDYTVEASTDLEHWIEVAGSDDREPYDGKPERDKFLARLTPDELADVHQLRESIGVTQSRIDSLSGVEQAWVGTFTQPETTHRLYRGDPFAKREAVAPDGLTVMGSLGMALDEPEQLRRAKLADWIARADNPLTARVLVNRVWKYIFGNGIVATPSDFGANGVPPTHPELLDWLADEFVQSGWSIKHIQRLILTSNTFQQSSQPQAEGMAHDAGNRLLWRFAPRRLEAEAIRDGILAVSGALDATMGGPGFYLHDVQEENVMHYFPKKQFGPSEFRRMVYQFKIRQEQDSIFGSFDCPDGNQVIPNRSRSNTPLQALNLFNSPFMLQQAELLAARLQGETGSNPVAQARRAFLLAFAREMDAFESETSVTMIETVGLEAFCRALFNTSEFLFVF